MNFEYSADAENWIKVWDWFRDSTRWHLNPRTNYWPKVLFTSLLLYIQRELSVELGVQGPNALQCTCSVRLARISLGPQKVRGLRPSVDTGINAMVEKECDIQTDRQPRISILDAQIWGKLVSRRIWWSHLAVKGARTKIFSTAAILFIATFTRAEKLKVLWCPKIKTVEQLILTYCCLSSFWLGIDEA